jgi:hypothetical protein
MLPRGYVDTALNAIVEKDGGFSTTLSFSDLLKLRAITKRLHMQHYPTEMVTDYEADRIIDVMAPDTMAYLIRQAVDGGDL